MAKIPFNSKSTADEVLEGVDLTNRTILVTGCSGGIGLETMRALASKGGHVIGLARSLDRAQRACSQVGGRTTGLVLLACVHAADLHDRDGARRLVATAGPRELTRLERVWADQGDAGTLAQWLRARRGWKAAMAYLEQLTAPGKQRGR